MLAREYCDDINRENKPIILLHHVLPNLLHPDREEVNHPGWAIFMDDSGEQALFKLRQAKFLLKAVEGNSCLEYVKHIVFPWLGKFKVARKEEDSGSKSMEELVADYASGALQPTDVRNALALAIGTLLQPIQWRFRSSTEANDLWKAIRMLAT